MPDQDSVAGNARLLRGLIWAGVLLAPVAALVVLLGQSSNTVRFAVLLIAVAVALIGASVLVRSDPVLGRMDIEDRVAEEVASLRRELRAEFGGGRPQGRGAAQVHGGPPPPMPAPAAAAVAQVRPQPPEEEPSGFFADLPAEGQYPDPFANSYPANAYPENSYPESDYPANEYADDSYQDGYPEDDYAPPMPAGPPPMGTARPPAPVASAAVRPPARTGPGMTTGGRPINPEPGTSTGGRVVAAAASVPPPPPIPRQRGAASVPPPPPPQAPPRASATVRPGNPYGHQPDSLADDFGASTGYAAQGPGVYGSPASGNTYGAPAGTYGGGNDFDSDEYNGYGAPSYGAAPEYGPGSEYGPAPEYGPPQHEPGNTTGDPNYKARRHRPSANDTNVGSLSDFASYGGYQPDPGHGRR
ncbi:hypothetical protein [Paractinoplanes lichenicola]|uniref:Uncharacterized protein n=1 Tax=Paractinoplanes lichenicola TaxID=2802976 RepID=A0ABS1VIP2_9ACTN|nr:hypothetical protein [Actinoplanes lichenicola]MBL7254473.1 hypothetical protein [Actinoplanes lichenicola]